MSSFIRRVESDAETAFRSNPTSPLAPRGVYTKALEELTNSLERMAPGTNRTQLESDICDLYISRAAMEIRFKQKKQAKLVFDDALSRDYCKRNAKLWKAYISFYIKEGKTESARKYFEKAVHSVDPSTVYQIWEFWVQFERNAGRSDLTIHQLKTEILKTDEPTTQQSCISQIQRLLTSNGTIDINALSESNGRSVHRDHRMMCLFQEPPPDIHLIQGTDDAPDIPEKILYYLGVVLTDPQVFEIIDTLREIQLDYMQELDLSQQLYYNALYNNYKNIDQSPEELRERCEADMSVVYRTETEGVNKLTKDFQEILNHAGLPGFCATEERNQLKIQRHLIKLIQLIGQERKEQMKAEGNVQSFRVCCECIMSNRWVWIVACLSYYTVMSIPSLQLPL